MRRGESMSTITEAGSFVRREAQVLPTFVAATSLRTEHRGRTCDNCRAGRDMNDENRANVDEGRSPISYVSKVE
jgi:hypothetical protein